MPTTSNIKKSLDDLEDMLVELQAIFEVRSGTDGEEEEEGHFDRATALELMV